MGNKDFVLLAATSKNASFNSPNVDVRDDMIVGLAVTTTAQSSLNVSIQLQASIDGVNFANVGSPTVVTTNTTLLFSITICPWTYVRLENTFSAGSATFKIMAQTKG